MTASPARIVAAWDALAATARRLTPFGGLLDHDIRGLQRRLAATFRLPLAEVQALLAATQQPARARRSRR